MFVPEVIALGDGPETFDIYLAQQFAWAYSMIQVLLRFTPQALPPVPAAQLVQFLFVQTWYTFFSLSMLVLFAAPLVVTASSTSRSPTSATWSSYCTVCP